MEQENRDVMTTSLRIEPNLYRAIKAEAALRNCPVGEVLAEAAREWLRKNKSQPSTETRQSAA